MCLADVAEEFLGVGAGLGAGTRRHIFFDFLPIFAKQF
jgi:hypothetical protein